VRWRDRVIGIVLGLILGVGIVTAFVFGYSERTVDAPSISGTSGGGEARGGGDGKPPPRPKPSPPPVATVRVINGAPPPSGPAELHYGKDELVRLRVISDGTVGVELMGYGIDRTIEAGKPQMISFKASKPGNFPLIVAASHIDVARITVGGPTL
jgi:hypothetical protein